ncbi:MAG: hypothetical protein HDS12_05545 [Bacteroides sp.]|nr:hypothetical protein [Bacteroides sp.]
MTADGAVEEAEHGAGDAVAEQIGSAENRERFSELAGMVGDKFFGAGVCTAFGIGGEEGCRFIDIATGVEAINAPRAEEHEGVDIDGEFDLIGRREAKISDAWRGARRGRRQSRDKIGPDHGIGADNNAICNLL